MTGDVILLEDFDEGAEKPEAASSFEDWPLPSTPFERLLLECVKERDRRREKELAELRAKIVSQEEETAAFEARVARLESENEYNEFSRRALIKRVKALEKGPSPAEITEDRIGRILNFLTKNGNGPAYVPWIKKAMGKGDDPLSDKQVKWLIGHLRRDDRFVVRKYSPHLKQRDSGLGRLKGQFVWLADRDPDWRRAKVR
jgi:septal ring factor EnvC (AmiA/AmiB activator)